MSKQWSNLTRLERDVILKNYHALERVDGRKDFQERARLLQSLWREEENLSPLVEKVKGRIVTRGAALEECVARLELSNYLTQTIRDVVKSELEANSIRSVAMRGLYAVPRIFNNLLSSQPMCFNLFGELTFDLDLATQVVGDLTGGRVARVREIKFEYSPSRKNAKYTGDSSAFDVYIRYENELGQKGFAGIEVKYHEDPNRVELKRDWKSGKHKPCEQLHYEKHGVRYEEIAKNMGCFMEDELDKIRRQPLQQFWRDHLLAGAHKMNDEFEDGLFAVLYPEGNADCRNSVNDYRRCLHSGDESFQAWTLDQFVEQLCRHSSADWIRRFHYRYLDFSRLPRCVSALVGSQ